MIGIAPSVASVGSLICWVEGVGQMVLVTGAKYGPLRVAGTVVFAQHLVSEISSQYPLLSREQGQEPVELLVDAETLCMLME